MAKKRVSAYQGTAPYFFVSYAHVDDDLVGTEMAWLQDAGFKLWYDEGIHVGMAWRKTLADNLAASSSLIFFATESSIVSEYCLKEINFALDEGVPVIVVHMDDAILPRQLRMSLSDRQALVRSELGEEDFRNQLSTVLSKALAKPIGAHSLAETEHRLELDSAAAATKASRESDITSIAVLPFTNLGKDDDTEYFSDGLTDELINALARVNNLRVVSRASVFAFKGKPVDIRTLGKRLNASTVLEGSVRNIGDKIRVIVQLTNVVDGFSLWSARFDRELIDIFAIQDEITEAIVTALQVKLNSVHKDRVSTPTEKSFQAYDLYLKGKYSWNRQTEDGLQHALQYYEQSIRCDPNLAVAHAGLADAYTSLGFHGFVSTEEALPKAQVAAKQALAINRTLPDALISMAFVTLFLDRDWDEAKAYLRYAIELNPSSGKAYYFLAVVLLQRTRFEPARAAISKAIELDPLNVLYYTAAGWAEYYARQPRVAIEVLEKALVIDADYPEIQVALGAAYEQLGLFDKAIQHMESAAAIYKTDPLVLAFLGATYGSSGDNKKALKALATLDLMAKERYVPSACRAIIYMGLHDREKAIEHLGLAVDARDAFLSWLNVLPISEWLREDPRFLKLLEKIGFVDQ